MKKLIFSMMAVFAIALMFAQDANAQMTHGWRLNDEYSASGGSGILTDWVILTPQADGTYKREYRDYNFDPGWCYGDKDWSGGPPPPPCHFDGQNGIGYSTTVTTYISGSAASAEIQQKYMSSSWSSGYTSF